MRDDEEYIVQPIEVTPELPEPYVGGFERVINARTGDAQTAMYVFELLAGGKKAYVGTFFGPFTVQAEHKFLDWLQVQSEFNLVR